MVAPLPPVPPALPSGSPAPARCPADVAEIGGKARELQHLCSLGLTNALVPPFCALRSDEVFAYLKKEIPSIETLWAQFQAAQGRSPLLTEAGKPILARIQEEIRIAFATHPPTFAELVAFLSQRELGPEVMVRSSSQEDSKTSPNAGGNKSLPSPRDSATAI